jgi:hypothetical protein
VTTKSVCALISAANVPSVLAQSIGELLLLASHRSDFLEDRSMHKNSIPLCERWTFTRKGLESALH